MSTACLALGANLGNRLESLRTAVGRIAGLPSTQVLRVSDVFQTEPVGGPTQDPYLNAVVVAATTLSPGDLLAACHVIEADLGRVREERWAARTIDIDLLSFDTLEMSGDLELPHPRAHERCFVLVPWEQVAPEQVLPGRGRVADVAVDVKRDGVMWYAPAADLLAGVSP